MTNTTADRVLFEHMEFDEHDQRAFLDSRAVIDGVYARVSVHTLSDGRKKVVARIRRHYIAKRASGSVYGYWMPFLTRSVFRTKQDLVLQRSTNETLMTFSNHAFADSSGPLLGDFIGALRTELLMIRGYRARANLFDPLLLHDDLDRQVRAVIGALPRFEDRYPLLRGSGIRTGHPAWLDAPDLSVVAKNLFGVKAYRRPLVAQIERLGVTGAPWFSLYRGLVPTEWIIEAMERVRDGQQDGVNASVERGIRQILVRTPQPVLRRILRENQIGVASTLRDAEMLIRPKKNRRPLRDIDQLPGLIAARGQKNVRGVRDLEQLILGMPRLPQLTGRQKAYAETMGREQDMRRALDDYRAVIGDQGAVPSWDEWKGDAQLRERAQAQTREAQEARLRAEERERLARAEERRQKRLEREHERAAWAARTAEQLTGQTVGGLELRVATDSETLGLWGAAMGNCIGSYADKIGLDVFFALVDDSGKSRVNVQVEQQQGVVQCLGQYNVDLVREVGQGQAQAIVSQLQELGLDVRDGAWGLEGLNLQSELQAA